MQINHQPPESFRVTERYSNEDIYRTLSVGNAGGVRVKTNSTGDVERIVIFTAIPSARQLIENPYLDRMEGDILIYTGEGLEGDQSISGKNARIAQQRTSPFPIYGFVQVGRRRDKAIGNKRWEFLGMLEFLRGYRERQIDAIGNWRTVWVFELRIHSTPTDVRPSEDRQLMDMLFASGNNELLIEESDVITPGARQESILDTTHLEPVRKKLLSYDPRQFEHVIQGLLEHSGFDAVEVTRYSQDGGIDINARVGRHTWPIRNLLIQLQAKRWLHTVGRKEVAELRGSLSPHAAGCIVTTSHFSRAALNESLASGKVPITLVDGHELASIVLDLQLSLD